MNRPGFMVYFDDFDALMELDDATAMRFWRMIYRYAKTGDVPVLFGSDLLSFTLYRNAIDRDENAYIARCTRNAYAGYRSAEKRAGREPLSRSEWEQQTLTHVDERQQSLTHVDDCQPNQPIPIPIPTPNIEEDFNKLKSRPDFSDEKPDDTPAKRKKRTYPNESTPYRAAAALARLMTENTPAMKPPGEAALQTWADSFRLLNERDGYDWDLINDVLVWCQDDPFWSRNILSGPTFRKQFGKLLVQMEAKR